MHALDSCVTSTDPSYVPLPTCFPPLDTFVRPTIVLVITIEEKTLTTMRKHSLLSHAGLVQRTFPTVPEFLVEESNSAPARYSIQSRPNLRKK